MCESTVSTIFLFGYNCGLEKSTELITINHCLGTAFCQMQASKHRIFSAFRKEGEKKKIVSLLCIFALLGCASNKKQVSIWYQAILWQRLALLLWASLGILRQCLEFVFATADTLSASHCCCLAAASFSTPF